MFDILYSDDQYVAVNKPGGLMMHASSLDRRSSKYLLQELKAQLDRWIYLVHRLDRPTSGVVLCALSKEAASAAAELFQGRRVDKVYWAIVRGHPDPSGTIERLLESPDRGFQTSTTHWSRMSKVIFPSAVGRYRTARYSLLSLSPKTGRRHQLRRHCAGMGHPIVGDVNHGDRHHNRFFREQLGIPGLFLHARALGFQHPLTGIPIQITAPPPMHWEEAGHALDWPELQRIS